MGGKMGKEKGKMSQAKGPALTRQMTEEEIQEQNTKLRYLEEEFNCMDVLGDNRLNYGEFVRLMRLLRYPTGHEGAKQIWLKQLGKNERSTMSKNEYVKLMTSDTTLEKLTSVWRCVYEEFDHDHSGWASKQDVINGLENSLGIPVQGTLREKIDAMDENGDGKIYYSNFLRMQLHLIQKQGSITHDATAK
ncbi:uncharacterized protein [Haliotis asinina]|uniref:uncharacterized protein isoform X2 n=2 Tax=Haliotis asinina TaxID=109174 RepID=UPI0035323B42